MEDIREQVRAYYGAVLSSTEDLQTDAACCTASAPPKYVLDVMPFIADEVIERFYGCGSPIPSCLEGATVLDLGCGTGRDVYVASKLVGESGHVIGVDMTPQQLDIARRYEDAQAQAFGFPASNVEFRAGYIEDLEAAGIGNESVDVVISNCVINLSPFKDQVLSEIYRVLKPGGELYFSDVFADRRIPERLANDPVVRGECLGGALYERDFDSMMKRHGWMRFEECEAAPIHMGNFALETKLGFIGFASKTIRAVKATGLEQSEEDYGQYATYLGTMPENARYFDFDSGTRFVRGKPVAVSGNTARILGQSRYGSHFSIGPAGGHRGAFDRGRAQTALDIRTGRATVDAPFLEGACERIGIPPFDARVGERALLAARPDPKTMQVNICYACNLKCRHCYLGCGPDRKERMSKATMESCLCAFAAGSFDTMDITGGSPELHELFPWFLREAASLGRTIVRSNLTLFEKPEYTSLLRLFAETGTRIVASLPFYDESGTDAQRGESVFRRAVGAIRRLNEIGYGRDAGLGLDLVYNVAGPFLPPPQGLLEEAYKEVLGKQQGIDFDNLLAFNNFPLGRFAGALADAGALDGYLQLLSDNFNTLAVTRMMCLDQVNVDFDGRLYDCECNHVLGLPIQIGGRDATVDDIAQNGLPERRIATSPVCYSCAAGFGSSCGGSLV